MGYFAYFNVVVHKLFFLHPFSTTTFVLPFLCGCFFLVAKSSYSHVGQFQLSKFKPLSIDLGSYEILKMKTRSILFFWSLITLICLFVVANFDIHIMDHSDIDLLTHVCSKSMQVSHFRMQLNFYHLIVSKMSLSRRLIFNSLTQCAEC